MSRVKWSHTMPRVYVSIGSNIGRERNVRGALRALAARFGALDVSQVYETAAVGFAGEPFYNLVAGFETDAGVDEVRAELARIEAAHGRVRAGVAKFSARTLDLDLLLYGDRVQHAPGLDLPHRDLERYAFVLGPLAELAPALVHPESGERLDAMWRRLFPDGGGLRAVDFDPGGR